jgi:hypothetical protein
MPFAVATQQGRRWLRLRAVSSGFDQFMRQHDPQSAGVKPLIGAAALNQSRKLQRCLDQNTVLEI